MISSCKGGVGGLAVASPGKASHDEARLQCTGYLLALKPLGGSSDGLERNHTRLPTPLVLGSA